MGRPIVIIAFVYFVAFLCIFGCQDSKDRPVSLSEKYPNYEYATRDMIPAESQQAYAEFVTKTVAASNLHMTGGDYEDPEDVVQQAEYTGRNIFEKSTEGLNVQRVENRSWIWEFVPKDELTPKQLQAFNELKAAQ